MFLEYSIRNSKGEMSILLTFSLKSPMLRTSSNIPINYFINR